MKISDSIGNLRSLCDLQPAYSVGVEVEDNNKPEKENHHIEEGRSKTLASFSRGMRLHVGDFQADHNKIKGRAEEFNSLADEFYNDFLEDSQVYFYSKRVEIMTCGYFILNDQYHNWRMNDGHNTEDAKICALTMLSIATIPPFESTIVDAAKLPFLHRHMNQLFAARCCQAISGNSLCFDDERFKNLWRRLFEMVEWSRLHSLEPFFQDTKLGIKKKLKEYSNGNMTIHKRDMFTVDAFISIFELLIELSDQSKG